MKKTTLAFMLLFVSLGLTQAQSKLAEFEALGLSEDKLLDTLIYTSFSLIRNQPQEALELSIEANKITIRNGDKNTEARTYYYIANSYFYLEEYEQSINTFYKGIKLAKKNNQESLLAMLYDKLGWTFYTINNYQTANKYYFEGLEYADTSVLPHIYHDIAANYQVQGRYDSCIYYYLKAYEITEKSNNLQVKMSLLNNLGTFYILTRDYEKAKDYIHESVELHAKSNNLFGYIASLNNLGAVYNSLGDVDSAIYCYKIHYNIFKQIV